MESAGGRKDIPNIGGSGLGDLLNLAEKLANQKGDEDAKQRVATLRGVLGGGEGDGEAAGPVIAGGVNLGSIFENLLGGGEEGSGTGIGDLFAGGKGEGSGGGLLGGVFSAISKIAETAQNLQGAGGDGTQEFTVPGGGKAVFHIETGGSRSTVQDRMRRADSGSGVKPTVVKSGNGITTAEPEVSEEVKFALQAFHLGTKIQVCGSISGVTDPKQVACSVIEGGTQLQVSAGECVHTVDLPAQVDAETAKANFSNGVFSVTLKKVEEPS